MVESMRILLAEDERTISRLINQVLTNAGHEVVAVQSVLDALEQFKARVFDLVLLDLHLADGDGMRLLSSLDDLGYPIPPVVLMTGEGSFEEGDPRASRVATVLSKPFGLDDLERTVNNFVA